MEFQFEEQQHRAKVDKIKELLKDVDLQDAMYAIKELEFDKSYQRLVEHYETFCDKTV